LTSIGHAVPRETREEFGLEWTQPGNIVVNGPYIVTEWEIDDYLVLEKNPSYYDADNVDIEKVTLLVVPELSTAMALYETGEIDSTDVPLEDLDRVKSDPVLSQEFYTGPRYVINYWGIDSTRPPFDDVLVRKAFAAAIDKQTLVEKIARGGQVPAPTVTPPGSFGHIPASEGVGIDFDPEQARAWLAEAGYPGGEGLATVVIGVSTSQLHLNTAQAIQKMWEDYLGVTAELRVWEGAGYNEAAGAGAFNVWRNGWGMDYPDAHNALGEIFRSSPLTTDAAFGRFLIIPEFDQLIDAAAIELDTDRRYEMYKEAERLLVEEYAATYPLFYYAVNIVTKPRINRPMVPSMSQAWWLWTVNE
jgi:oligopeptide transport system substrate-binding protein